MTIRVIIADDQPLLRTAVTMSLTAEPDIEVIGEAADGLQAIDLATRLQPDVIVMDIRMPRLDGVAATRVLTDAAQPRPHRILVMTTFDLDEYVVEALRSGASGFIVKDATSHELVSAVRTVASGDALIAPRVMRRLLDRYAHLIPPPVSADRPTVADSITKRELAVLMLVARGMSNAEIGRELHLAESSVKTHVSHLLTKLAKQDRVHLVIFAYEVGLIQSTGMRVMPD